MACLKVMATYGSCRKRKAEEKGARKHADAIRDGDMIPRSLPVPHSRPSHSPWKTMSDAVDGSTEADIAIASEGCGDSFDDACTLNPVSEVGFSTPAAEDACDATGPSRRQVDSKSRTTSKSTAQPPLIIRLPTAKSRRLRLAPSAQALSGLRGVQEVEKFQEGGGCKGVQGRGAAFGTPKEAGPITEEERNRQILVANLAEAALHLEEGPRTLYLAVAIMDVCLEDSRRRGKKLDFVQRDVLALTCLYVACKQISMAPRGPDDFCAAAGVKEGTVKGCMINRQAAVVEGLLGFSAVAEPKSSRSIWLGMQPSIEATEEEYMARFVCEVATTDYGKKYFSEEVVGAAAGCWRLSPSSEADADALQLLGEFLYQPGNGMECPLERNGAREWQLERPPFVQALPCQLQRARQQNPSSAVNLAGCFSVRKELACR